MNIGLIYLSKTGHSKKIAKAVAQKLQIEAIDIRTNPKLDNIDLLYIVGGIYGGLSAPELVSFVKTITSQQVKKVVLMTSSAGKIVAQTEIRDILIRNGINVIDDEFKCQGSFLFVGMRHPNAADIENAASFAKEISNQI